MNKYRKTCTECMTENNIQHKFCSQCGAVLPPLTEEQSEDLTALFDNLKFQVIKSHRQFIDVTQDNLDTYSKTLLAFITHHNQLNDKPRLVKRKKFQETSEGLLRVLFLISAAMPSTEVGVFDKKLPIAPACQTLADLCRKLALTTNDLYESYNLFLDTRSMQSQKISKQKLLEIDKITHEINDEIIRLVEGQRKD